MQRKMAVLATVAGIALAGGSGTAATAAEPTTCDQVRTVLVADQKALTADRRLAKTRTVAVAKARTAVRKARGRSATRRRAAARQLTLAKTRLARAKAKQVADGKVLLRHQELAAELCTPGY
ncbi:MAG: hypothetical protein JWO90_762 [Solirubrobacterales bacterium]|jgi:hypothetical protein|nr:hypothetical protein [Solirubrobacterales bacterium]